MSRAAPPDLRLLERLWDQLIPLYFLATPVFAAVDLLGGDPVRAAGLPRPGWRVGYYVVLMVLGLLCRARPSLAPAVGMAESSVNLLLLILSVMMPIWDLPSQVLADEPVGGVLTSAQLWNVAIAGSMAILSFHRHRRAVATPGRGPYQR